MNKLKHVTTTTGITYTHDGYSVFQTDGIKQITSATPRATEYSDDKKRLFLACLKENFTFLDFWEKEGARAKAAARELDRHRKNDFSDLREKCGLMIKPFVGLQENDFVILRKRIVSGFDEVIGAIKHHYQCNGPLVPVGGWKDHTLTGLDIYRTVNTLYRFDGYLGRVSRLRMWGNPAGFLPALEILDPATKETPAELPFYFYDDVPAITHELARRPFEAGSINTSYLKPSERLLRVDLSRKKSELLAEFKAFLDQVDRLRKADTLPKEWADNYQAWTPDTSRERAEAWHQLKIWRMRKERIPFSEIARAMEITQDAAKKAFYRAYERTQGRVYEPDRYRKDGQKTNTWDLTKTCQTCPDRQTCTELCPEILRFADQDYTGRKESFLTY